MGKNKGKGGKAHRKGASSSRATAAELIFREAGQEYAQATRMLGGNHVEVACMDGITRLAHIRGKMQKKSWVAAGDIVLVALRDYEVDKCDIVHKYATDEARELKARGELPPRVHLSEDGGGGGRGRGAVMDSTSGGGGGDDDGYVFDAASESSGDEEPPPRVAATRVAARDAKYTLADGELDIDAI